MNITAATREVVVGSPIMIKSILRRRTIAGNAAADARRVFANRLGLRRHHHETCLRVLHSGGVAFGSPIMIEFVHARHTLAGNTAADARRVLATCLGLRWGHDEACLRAPQSGGVAL